MNKLADVQKLKQASGSAAPDEERPAGLASVRDGGPGASTALKPGHPPGAALSQDGLRPPPTEEPFYSPTRDEVALFQHCHENRLAVMLKGPTGCGKTRFVEHMAWKLQRPLITVSCHDDLSASDLIGRYLIK